MRERRARPWLRRSRPPDRPSSPKPPGSSPPWTADMARSSLGPGLDGIIVVAKPAGPTSHDVVALVLVSWDGSDPERPIAILDVVCSAGTYVRSLGRDLGEIVGSAAYLGALTRRASGPFTLDDAVTLDELRAAAAESPLGLLPYL